MPRFGTFSIVAYDRERSTWGVAVQSKFISVGSVVPWGKAEVGAIATQALANVAYGPDGLSLLAKGRTAEQVVRTLTSADAKRDERQLGVVDANGGAAAYTGAKCLDWAGHRTGDGFTCQGNILFSEAVVTAMARTFSSTPGDLPERLLAALSAAQREGGDRRGMQSAAMLLVREKGGYDDGNDRWVDLRVDDHPAPIEELKRVFQLYDLTLLSREDPATLVTATPEVTRLVQQHLTTLGYLTQRPSGSWDAATTTAFGRFISEHNFENKHRPDGKLWPSILAYLDERAATEVARRTTTAPIEPGALSKGPGARGEGRRGSKARTGDAPPS